jgi:NadR type nicotinamide-nucleotide adenylyltransferase
MEKKTNFRSYLKEFKLMLKRIAITGPESTGKSSITKELAEHYNCRWVPEFARQYLNKTGNLYNYADILAIAKGQKELEDRLAKDASGYLFCDTELTVTKIWCEYKYGKVHPWITENHNKQNYSLYLLMDIDLPWQPDPLREHPEKRNELFHLYVTELQSRKWPYEIISGSGRERFNHAVEFLNQRFT